MKDSLLRLKEKQIKDLKNNDDYETKIKELEKEYQDEKNKKGIKENKYTEETDTRTEHQKRVAEILGN